MLLAIVRNSATRSTFDQSSESMNSSCGRSGDGRVNIKPDFAPCPAYGVAYIVNCHISVGSWRPLNHLLVEFKNKILRESKTASLTTGATTFTLCCVYLPRSQVTLTTEIGCTSSYQHMLKQHVAGVNLL